MRKIVFTVTLTAVLAGAAFAQGTTAKPKAGTPARKATAQTTSKAAAGALSDATIMSFLNHMFGYQQDVAWSVKGKQQLPGTSITDVTIEFRDKGGQPPQVRHLYVLGDRKHAIAGAAEPFDPGVNPKMANGLPTEEAVKAYVRKKFLQGQQNVNFRLDIRKSEQPGLTEANVGLTNQQGAQAGGRLYITTNGDQVLTGEVIPFGADPFASARAALTKANGVSKGPQNAAVTIIEFSDLQCPACKAAQPVIDQLLSQVKDVRFVFQNFPLEQLHPWAFRAASYAECIGRENNNAFWKFINSVYENQESINTSNVDSKLTQLGGSAGVDGSKLKGCVEDPNTKARIWSSQQLGKEVEVTGTPTLFINGRKVGRVRDTPVDVLKTLVEFERKNSARK